MIHVSIVYIWDESGFIEAAKAKLGFAERSLKPLDCSLCMTFWVVLAYGIFIAGLGAVGSAFAAVILAASCEITLKLFRAVMLLLESLADKLICRIQKFAQND